jgi:DNA-binding CsgD family transcriptional regulator
VNRDVVSLLDTAYQIHHHESVWVRSLRGSMEYYLGMPDAILAMTYQQRGGQNVIRCFDLAGASSSSPLSVREAAQRLPLLWSGTIAARASALSTNVRPARLARELGFEARDFFGLNALDPTGYGILIALPLARRSAVDHVPPPSMWEHLSAHLSAAFRLERVLGQGALTLEATLDPAGKVVEASGPANAKEVRVLLRDACQVVDRVRRGDRTDPAALNRWTSLFGARWSLLDSFDREGRRYVVAARNTFYEPGRGLTEREAQIVALIALGHSNKLIAYELGLAWSTVRVLIQRAARKLGVRTRRELEEKAKAFPRRSDEPPGSPATGQAR